MAAFETFDVFIDGDQIGGLPENGATLVVTANTGTLKDADGNKFKFPKPPGNISLPYTLELPTDVAAGAGVNSENVGYTILLTTSGGGMVRSEFAARPAGTVVALTDLTETVVMPISDTVLARDQALAARDETLAAAASVPGMWQPSTVYTAGSVKVAPDGTTLSRVANGTSRATFDATEQAAWTVVLTKTGTMAEVALKATFAAALHIQPGKAGVLGNGTGDDTAAVQAILDQVSTALGVTTVVIHAGTYMIDGVTEGNTGFDTYKDAGLRPKSGTTLLLAPDAILKLIPNAYYGSSVIFLGYDKHHISIRGGQILGDRATHDYTTNTAKPTHEWGFGIAMNGAQDILVEGVKITGCTGDGIFLGSRGNIGGAYYNDCQRVTIRKCNISGSRRNNISVTSCDLVLIEDCEITDAGINDGIHDGTAPRAGIDIEGYGEGDVDFEIPYRVTVRGNKFVGNVTNSVMNYNGYRCVIENNFADTPISFGYATEAVIQGNVLINTSDTTNPGISSNIFSSGTPYAAHSLIANNIVRGFGTGIKIQRDNVMASENYLSGFQSVGIDVFSASQVTLQGNRIADGTASTAKAIQISTATYARAVGNEIHNVAIGFSVTTSSTNITLRNNSVTKGNQGFSIGAGCSVLIKGNVTNLPGHAAGQSYDATWASTSIVTCEDNTFRNSSTYSINAVNASGGTSRMLRNKILDHTGPNAVSMSGTNGAHEFIDNLVVHNRATTITAAIFITTGSGSRIIGNTFYNLGAGAYTNVIQTNNTSSTARIARNTMPTATLPINHHSTDTLTDNVVVGGGVLAKSANYTTLTTDRTVLATGGASGITITLPDALAGLRYEVKKVDAGAGAVTVATTNSQTIDGASTKSLAAQYDKLVVVSDGTAWHVVG